TRETHRHVNMKAGGGTGGERQSQLRQKRVDVNKEFDSVHQLTDYLSNISRTGAFIRARDPWPVGTRLNLRFTVLLDDPEFLEGVGLVTRVSDRPRGMGVRFLQLSIQSRKLIDRILARKAQARR